MKLTRRGNRTKDNSRKTGAAADKVQARRDRAKARFKILSLIQFMADRNCRSNAAPFRSVDEAKVVYDGYVERKKAEAASLGL